jgi:hypothetical protein
MSAATWDAIRNASLIASSAILFGIFYVRPFVRWVRAWLYVRIFLRYEMPGCAVEAKVREGQG